MANDTTKTSPGYAPAQAETPEPAARGSNGAPGAQGQADKPSMLPAITTPKGGGAIKGIGEKFSVAAATGTASLSVPLPVSPGRNGFGPAVSLGYDSGHGNGPFGLGFALSIPAITRKTDKGLPRYIDVDESDEFILSGAEDLVPARRADGKPDALDRGDHVVQQYRPRVEGLFARIERHTVKATGASHWQVTTKDNVTHIYGKSDAVLPPGHTIPIPAPRIFDPKDPSRVFSWLLEESRDDRGNVVRYEYKAEDGAGVDATKPSERSRFETQAFVATAQRYLKRALYGNATPKQANDFLFELVFDYGDHLGGDLATPADDGVWPVRIDPFSSYRAAFEVRTYRLCQRVLMFHRLSAARTPVLVKSTDFFYDDATPAFTYLRRIIQRGYIFNAANTAVVQKLAMPTLALDYVHPVVHDELAVLPPESLDGLTGGVGGGIKQWVDLDGEGIPGVLIDEQSAWTYKANGGGGQLAAPRAVPTMPSASALAGGIQQLQDLGGDGQLDLVAYAEPLAGFASRTPDGDFEALRAFPSIPNVDWHDPELRFVDLDGDGLGDLLITEDQAFTWYRSRAKDGFEPARRVAVGPDEDRAPTLAYTDDTQAIQLVDMSGDGLVDIVRVRNGEVSYWPNLGYGRFGAKVTLEQSPVLAGPEEFDPRRVRFGDVDGTGASDLIYLGPDGVRIYFNQSGNALSAPTKIESLPPMDSAGRIDVVDLLGTGTASLVWSSPLPAAEGRQVMYVDLMNGVKPHLMKSVVNNLGAETQVTYAPSTKFYLEDKAAGIKWLTRLAFPVHVVERVDHIDAISNSHLTSLYRYRHGFFDGVEREFRGFAYVEQVDAEAFTLNATTTEFQPPTRTKTWFHTGAWLERTTLETELAKEYAPSIPQAMLLPDTIIPAGMSIQDEREAMRALRGRMLHQEILADDADDPNVGPIIAARPFASTEQSFEVTRLQTSDNGLHGVFFVFPRETIAIHTERAPTDPRVTHDFVLTVDGFGNVERSAAIAYGRSAVGPTVQPEQQRAWATMSVTSYINKPGPSDDDTNFYRLGLPYETISYELTGLANLPLAGVRLYTRAELEAAITASTANDVPYDVALSPTTPGRRMLDRKQQLYYANDPVTGAILGAAAPQDTGSLALPFESYQLALTAGLVNELVSKSTSLSTVAFDPLLLKFNGDHKIPEGYYVQRPNDSGYWVPSGQIQFSAGSFYVPSTLTDPFGFVHAVTFDGFKLLVEKTQDPLGNIVQAVNDYRVLAPSRVTDPNLNQVEVEFDALGMVVKTAVKGKTTEALGDTLADPTTTLIYDVRRWETQTKPVVVHTIAREVHGPANTRNQQSYTYSDGFGRIAMTKVQAEPDPQTPTVPRWVGSGRTVFNNKGNAVKKYEPFFSATFEFEDEATVVQAGVTSIIHYDALDRAVRTELPNRTESRVTFDVWTQIASDPNDTVIGTPWWVQRGSPQPNDPEPSNPETRAAWLAARHDGTPTMTHFDALGRAFLVVEHNRTYATDNTVTDELLSTKTVLDVEGNALAMIDPRQAFANPNNPLPTLTQRFDVLSRVQFSDSIDAGQRLMVADVAGKPLFAWDNRSQIFRHRYDALQRPTHVFVQKTRAEGSGAPGETPEVLTDRLLIRTVYGEALDLPGPAPMSAPGSAAQALNLRGQAYLLYDCAGKVTHNQFDFKANLLSSTRRLASNFQTEPNWSAITEITNLTADEANADLALDAPVAPPAVTFTVFTVVNEYDALNRVTKQTAPDLSETSPAYNDAGLLERVSVRVRDAATSTVVVSNIDYNARGQRVRYEYADPVLGTAVTCRLIYTYDPATFRLTNVTTNRLANTSLTPPVPAAKLQDLTYTYDPIGNVVELDDAADRPPIFVGTDPVDGNGLYRYDALYRLIQATGREHPGQQPIQTQPRGGFELPMEAVPHPNDLTALLRYREVYSYDRAGNITQIDHTTTQANGSAGASNTIWTRHYSYASGSNRLLSNDEFDATNVPTTATFTYTGNGAMKRMAHLQVIEWDYADRMRHANKGGGGDVFFTYDGAGQRVRKVWVKTGSIDERIYVGGWETFRQRNGAITSAPTLQRETLHVTDDHRRVAMVETKTLGGPPTEPRWRFQLTNLLGSSMMELNAQGRVISYEEYHPYGSTAFQSATGEVSAKRYRYSGKEKDEETGLYYHGARYYVPWLGRWTAADPAGLVDGPNLYRYGRNNPVVFVDRRGTTTAAAAAAETAESVETAEVVESAAARAAARWGLTAAAPEAAAPAVAPAAAPAIAPAAAPAAPVLPALGSALGQVAALYLLGRLYTQRTANIARYGNPFVRPDSLIPLSNDPRFRSPVPPPGVPAPPPKAPAPTTAPSPVGPIIPTIPRRSEAVPQPSQKGPEAARKPDQRQQPDPAGRPVPVPAPKPDPKDQDKRAFVVRLQAQGEGVEESVVLSGPVPVTVAEGLAGLELLKTKLSARELKVRLPLFVRAARFIANAPAGGGVGPPGRSFPIHPRHPVRVDVEVLRGVNFQR